MVEQVVLTVKKLNCSPWRNAEVCQSHCRHYIQRFFLSFLPTYTEKFWSSLNILLSMHLVPEFQRLFCWSWPGDWDILWEKKGIRVCWFWSRVWGTSFTLVIEFEENFMQSLSVFLLPFFWQWKRIAFKRPLDLSFYVLIIRFVWFALLQFNEHWLLLMCLTGSFASCSAWGGQMNSLRVWFALGDCGYEETMQYTSEINNLPLLH